MQFFELKSLILGQFVPLTNCHNNNSNFELQKFLNQNPTITIVKVDKSSNLAVLNTSDYLNKLHEQFADTSKFTRLSSNPFYSDLTKLHRCIHKLDPYTSKSDKLKLRPIHNLKQAYGILKLHRKDSQDLRPIVSSTKSLTIGAENYLQPILEKFRPIIGKHTLQSTKNF